MSQDGVWNPPPRIVEITIYENRRQDHVIVVKRGKHQRQRVVRYPERTDLHHSTTEIAELLREITDASEQHVRSEPRPG